MKAIREKMNQERIKSIRLKEYSFDGKFDKNVEIQKYQQKVYDKFIFFKKLNEAVNKLEKEEVC